MHRGLKLFFSVGFFILLFFVFWGNGAFAQSECKRADGSIAPKDATACGKDISSYQTPHYIYKCLVLNSPPGGFSWQSIGLKGFCDKTAGCTTTGNTASCNEVPEDEPKDCAGTTLSGVGPPGLNLKLPATSHGSRACSTGGGETYIYSYECVDGTFTNREKCVSTCAGGICDDDGNGGGGGDGGGGDGGGGDDGGGDDGGGNDGGGDDGGGNDGGGGGGGGGTPPKLEGIFQVIYNAVEFFFGFIAIVAAAMVVYGAYMWMASAGDPQKTKMAQGVLTWAIVGLIFFIIAPFLLDFILGLLGIQLPTPSGTPLF